MKIRKIKFENHPILKNLELDFTDENGNTVNTIIIAGENGVGKSVILNSIFSFSLNLMPDKRSNEKRIFEIELTEAEMKAQTTIRSDKGYYLVYIDFNYFQDYRGVNFSYFNNGTWIASQKGSFLKNTTSSLKALFSDVEVNFIPSDIRNVTSKNVDDHNTTERSGKNLATDITQLLIDIQSLDALELNEWARENIGNRIKPYIIDKRIKRFTNAFHYIFPTKRYKKIINSSKGKEIIFEDSGNEMSIAQLSSGEKQIVFRGSFLLKNKESAYGALVLIDEPELSLHPNWQLKILNFFKKLFTDENGQQTSQLIVSTHSPFIVHNANRLDDKVIVLKKDDSVIILVPQDPKFYTWTN